MTQKHHLPRAAAIVALIALFTGCASATAPAPTVPAAEGNDWSAMTLADVKAHDPIDLVDALEALPTAERPSDLRVSVRPDSLLITALDGEDTLALPDDLFYLSIAPYVTGTHDCFFHSLTTCHGELGGKAISLIVTTLDGEVLVNETRTAADNGFVGLWLPRGISGQLTVSSDGGTSTTAFSTGPEDPTCITTLQLT